MFSHFVKNSILVIVLSLSIVTLIFIASLVPSGERVIDPLETIHAIDFPTHNSATIILEKLAHADVFINAPVFAKTMKLQVKFNPGNTSSIDIGVRTGSFWLGYKKLSLYKKGIQPEGDQEKTLVFPLTGAFQDTNQSIDIMVFSENESNAVMWSVQDIHATVYTTWPSIPDVKDYIKSIWNKEREI